MATVQLRNEKAIEPVERYDSGWSRHFGAAECQHMLREDSAAFRAVAIELLAIVALGFTLIATTVALITIGG